MLILYAIVARIPIENMFLGGIIPGIVMVAATAWWGIRQGRGGNVSRQMFDLAEAGRAVWDARWELLLPVLGARSARMSR